MFAVWLYYSLLVGPLVYFLFKELRGGQEAKPLSPTQDGSNGPSLLTWVAVYIALFVVERFVVHGAGLTHHERGPSLVAQDALWGMVAAALLYLGTGVRGRLAERPYVFVGCVAYFTIAYTGMFEISRHLHITLSSHLADGLQGALLAVTTFVIVFAVVAHSFLARRASGKDKAFLRSVAAVVALHILAYCIGNYSPTTPANRGSIKVHIHHQWWALVVSLAPSNHASSMAGLIAQAMLVGINLHGLAAFGAQPIFNAA